MDPRLQKLYADFYELLDQFDFREEDLDYSLIPKHIAMLQKLNVIESSNISVFDLYKREHLYISAGFALQLGWNLEAAEKEGAAYMDTRIHPDDLLRLAENGNYFLRMALYEIDSKEWKNFKMINDYRVLNAQNEYIRVIEQHLCLQEDKRGRYWLDLSILDISPDTDVSSPSRCRLMNFKTGELFELPVNAVSKEENKLSTREQEVLQLIAVGLASKQIADKLYISVNTVNTHRQRIIEKLNVSNTAEAIHYASAVGWL
ncbi:MAG TPA: LuxR C-terminal-related transcriptional regulator [Bacteroidales bacterium]|nr:LuxR C-terminal-related transcriptional regulator [Bacteroidales bacterium]